jgi:hypothetical protein
LFPIEKFFLACKARNYRRKTKIKGVHSPYGAAGTLKNLPKKRRRIAKILLKRSGGRFG